MSDNTNKKVIIGGIIAFILLMLILIGVKSCKKEEPPSETVAPTMESTVTEETEDDSKETTGAEVIDVIPEETIPENKEIDAIIDQLIKDADQEKVETSAAEEDKPSIDNSDRDFEKQIAESVGVTVTETDENGETIESDLPVDFVEESEYDSDNNPITREIEAYDSISETEPIIGEDGTPERTPEYKMQEAYKHTHYEGAKVEKNDSSSMKVGKIYHYFNDDGSKYGEVGDIVMCGQLGVDVVAGAARDGYYLNSYGNTVEIDTLVGLVRITKLNTDNLEVSKMSDNQIRKLAGDDSLTYRYMNASKGSREEFSTILFDTSYTNGVQYYACPEGIYEIKYFGRQGGVGINLTGVVMPDSTTN